MTAAQKYLAALSTLPSDSVAAQIGQTVSGMSYRNQLTYLDQVLRDNAENTRVYEIAWGNRALLSGVAA